MPVASIVFALELSPAWKYVYFQLKLTFLCGSFQPIRDTQEIMEVDLACMLFSHVTSPSPTHLEISQLIEENGDVLSHFGSGPIPDNARWRYGYDVIDGVDVAMMTSSPYAAIDDDYIESPEVDELEVTGTICNPMSPSSNAAAAAGQRSQMSSTSQAPLLPPCRVCGEKASGFHYGANTCEACKVDIFDTSFISDDTVSV
jgi:hypothetical protein